MAAVSVVVQEPAPTEQWVKFDGHLADKSVHDVLLRSNRAAGGSILVKNGDYSLRSDGVIEVRVDAEVSIVEQPNAQPSQGGDPDCGPNGSACIGGDKICCNPQRVIGECELDSRCP